VSLHEYELIKKEWEKQAHPGSRPIIWALPEIRVRAVREVVAELKRQTRKRYEEMKLQNRKTVIVHKAGAVTAMDGATIIKGEDIIVYRDRGSLRTESEKCDGHLNAKDTIRTLEIIKNKKGLPLVICTDNGSPFCANVVENYFFTNQIVHLKSLPYVPQHNGSGECAVKEAKAGSNYGRSPQDTCINLNYHRLRRKLGYKTSLMFEQENAATFTKEDRALFFNATCSAIQCAVIGTKSAHEKRKAERKAIFETMERFSLITIIRGHQPA
jgi:hypothetical protein